MNKFRFAIITPSYAPDFERCQLLCQSIERFLAPPFTHYIVVDQKDLPLFRHLQKANTQVITVESILPWWIKRIAFIKKTWISFKTIPIRNWLIQQLVKIAISQQIQEDVAIFIDSDVVFIRPFNLENIIIDDNVRLFCNPQGNDIQKQMHLKWHQTASRVLGLSDVDLTIPDYIGNIISWKKENVLQMCQHIESVTGQGWIQALANSWHLSEYVLYGTFINRILKEKSGHYCDAKNLCHDYWVDQPLSDEQLRKFLSETHPDHVAVMISAKAGMSVTNYKTLLEDSF